MTEDFAFTRFYLFEEGFTRGALRVRSRTELPADPYRLMRAEATVVEPIIFDYDEGKRPHDLIGTTWAVLNLVSDRFIAVLRDGGFRGWDTYPVVIVRKDGKEVPGYHGLAITGRCGPIQWDKSERVILPRPVTQGRTRTGWRGLYFSPDSWDGSDLFVPTDGSAYVVLTEAVKTAIETGSLTNVTLTRLTDFERIWNRSSDGNVFSGGMSP